MQKKLVPTTSKKTASIYLSSGKKTSQLNINNKNINNKTNLSMSKTPVTKSLKKIVEVKPKQNPVKELPYNDDEPIQEQSVTPTTYSENEIEKAITLSLRLKRKIIQSSSFNAQSFPMLASLQVDNLKSSAKAPLDLVCVIDHSGSMMGEKMELVKNTFNYLLNYLGDNDRLSIVIFDDQVKRLFPLKRTTINNKEFILEEINKIQARGGTDINLGMRHAFRILNERKYKNSVSSIFLLSDGLDRGAQKRVKKTLNDMKVQEGITIHTFGFGNAHDPQLMNDIADLRDGNFYFIKELDTVDEAFVDCLGGLLSVIGQNIIIKIKPENSSVLQGVDIIKAYGDDSMWNREGKTFITKLSTLISGICKDFVLELSIPANSKELQDHEKNIIVATAEADITTLDGKHLVKKAELNITLLNEGEECKDDEEDNREVMKNFFRLKGVLVMTEARMLADQRKYDEANKKLQSFKEELENSFLKNEEFIQNLIRDIEQAIENVKPVVYEQMGKHEMMENVRAQMYQKSNLKSANSYQNRIQSDMMRSVKMAKKKF